MGKSKFVISLDFELHWGVFDTFGESYNENILGARKAVPKILALFENTILMLHGLPSDYYLTSLMKTMGNISLLLLRRMKINH